MYIENAKTVLLDSKCDIMKFNDHGKTNKNRKHGGMKKMTLYVNCCARENSRTNRLAYALLDRLGGYEEIFLYEEDLQPLNQQRLEQRTVREETI